MNSQVKEQWLNALRSNEYQQTTGRLKTDEGFCCLGVLTDLYIQETLSEWSSDGQRFYCYMGRTFNLPIEVAKWSDLNSSDPVIDNLSLSEYNDCKGYTFNQIADLIGANL